MTRALPLVLATLIAGAPLAAGGQQSDDMISRRLVALLFPGMIDSIVEGLAEEVPETLLPDGATPLVSSTSSRGVTVVAELPSFAAADRPRYERKLAAAGWKEGEGPFTSHGWTMSSRAAADGVSMARFAVTPDTGTDKSPRLATLEALTLPDGNVLVTLRVMGPRRGW